MGQRFLRHKTAITAYRFSLIRSCSFWNRSIFSTSGIAKPPATWEALTGLVPNMATLTPTRQITRGLIALGTYNNVHTARGILSSLFLQQGVPLSSYSANGTLAANLGVTASSGSSPGQSVLGFYTQFADPSKVSYTWNASLPDSEQSFLVGDLALYLGYASRARYLRVANPNLNFNVAPLPQSATARVKSAYGLIYALMIPRGAKNAAGAYQVAATLSNVAEQSIAAAATGLAPATVSVLATEPADPVSAVAYATALYTKGWLSPAPADTDAVFSGMIGNVISGRLTVEAALAEAERSLNSLLQNNMRHFAIVNFRHYRVSRLTASATRPRRDRRDSREPHLWDQVEPTYIPAPAKMSSSSILSKGEEAWRAFFSTFWHS